MQAFLSGLKALLTDLIDNDTMIIVGLFAAMLFVEEMAFRSLCLGGILTFLGTKQEPPKE